MIKKMLLGQKKILNINIKLSKGANASEFKFLDDLLGDFIMLLNGKLIRGYDSSLKTAYADIGRPAGENNLYHVHYSEGSVGYLKKKGSCWFVNEDANNFDCATIKELKQIQPYSIYPIKLIK